MKIQKLALKNSSVSLASFYQTLVNIIREGKVIAFPTDTVYGLLANATDKKSVERVYKIKKRPFKKYLPFFIKDMGMAKQIAKITPKKEKFLRKVWPGKVTVILKRKKGIKLYGAAPETIALRIPNFKLLNLLLELINIPLTATSANISGNPPSCNIKEIIKQFADRKIKPALIVDAGNLPKRNPSTVVDLTKEPPEILRV